MPDRTGSICKRCGNRSGKITTTWRHSSNKYYPPPPVQAQIRCDQGHIWYTLGEWQAVTQNYVTTVISEEIIRPHTAEGLVFIPKD